MSSTEGTIHAVDLAVKPFGWLLLLIFVVGYYFIAAEEKYHINKAKPALFTGTFMFMLLGIYYALGGHNFSAFDSEIEHLIVEIAEIFFFLFVAMTYIEALIERNVFDALKEKLLKSGFNYKKLFWSTGLLAFFISPVADNLTTALILSTVLITIEKDNKAFLIPAAINIVVAANAGGAWSPFGDTTTLLAWSSGKGAFVDFLFLFPASIIGWAITGLILSRYIPEGHPQQVEGAEPVQIHKGGMVIAGLGVLTIASAVIGKQAMHLPPMWGMLFGLSLLQLYAYTLKKYHNNDIQIYKSVSKVENDTLLFFFGILAAVGALHFAGFLDYAAKLYTQFNPTYVNIGVGFLSAIVDNVPVMSAVIKSSPDLPLAQWMLVTLTAGIGGSLISFGSAAGVGVMGKLKGVYTFSTHMKYAWTIIIGYAVSIGVWYIQFEALGFYINSATQVASAH
ncbi:sodium:proton antiporter NhaD [Reinekea marinisedimentorum]|uniref:Na+/H+ antiporter NhaD/arsenite permease-like protein n=1 Tax=Reinekea marinisedimentorum TaxID=230495 RepID=A0A4R3HVY6_9GAMM|nr:sodium:proton antiporter NhaD [Reinekea marinisedimentorum]TCS35197.1 Na+/H+ antiporter NhaD/arsenite permease-like protein [Reinekea marinisedimentorum]